MPRATLELRIKALELQVAQLQEQVHIAQNGPAKDWRSAIGAFSDDEGMKELFQDALRLREIDRRKTRSPKR